MKSILILRGIPGSGKSSWIKDNKLEEFVINKDLIRQLFGTVDWEDDLNLKINIGRLREDYVDEIYTKALESKLSKGNFIVVDCCNITAKSINKVTNLAEIFGYTVFMKSFFIPHNVYDRLKKRPSLFKPIPREIIEKYTGSYLQFNKSQCINSSSIIEIELLDDISYYWKQKVFYEGVYCFESKKVNHLIGDIHGVYDKLSKIDIKDDELYIFHGDYCDRGSDPVGVLKRMIDLSTKKNIVILEGNHELHLRRWAYDLPPVSKSFIETTLPHLEKEGEEFKKDIKVLFEYMLPFALLKLKESEVICSHAGLINHRIVYSDKFYRGIGTLISGERDIDIQDRKFSKSSNRDKFISSHGHISYITGGRNKYKTVINLDSNPYEEGKGIIDCIISDDLSINIIEHK